MISNKLILKRVFREKFFQFLLFFFIFYYYFLEFYEEGKEKLKLISPAWIDRNFSFKKSKKSKNFWYYFLWDFILSWLMVLGVSFTIYLSSLRTRTLILVVISSSSIEVTNNFFFTVRETKICMFQSSRKFLSVFNNFHVFDWSLKESRYLVSILTNQSVYWWRRISSE